jgi:hypothetical protein
MSVTGNSTAIAQARTKPFEVVSHRDYVAARTSRVAFFSCEIRSLNRTIHLAVTGLTQCLTRQGVRL